MTPTIIKNIKFTGKHKNRRKIKFEINGVKNFIYLFNYCLAFGKYVECTGNTLDTIRKLYIINYLWLYGWDLDNNPDFSEDTLIKQLNHDVKVGRIFEDEKEYLIKNIITDYRKNKVQYPSFNPNI